MRMKNDFHIKGRAPTLVLKQRPGGTRKCPIPLRLPNDPVVTSFEIIVWVIVWVLPCRDMAFSDFVMRDLRNVVSIESRSNHVGTLTSFFVMPVVHYK